MREKYMNLRDLNAFVASEMVNQLTEGGIKLDQISQIKIYDRQFPSNDNDDNLVWELKANNLSFSCVVRKIERWIETQIIICYMNNTDRDLSIEIKGNGKGMMAI